MRLLAIARSLLTGARLARRPTGRLRPLDLGPFADALAGLTDERRRELTALILDVPIAQLQDHLAAGRCRAEELVLLCIDRTRRYDPALGSTIELNPDALEEARLADERRRRGATLGPLDGIPVTVKDNIDTAGPMRTTAGAALLADRVAAADAAVVTSLRAAGAVVLGKANLSELAGAVSRVAGASAVGGRTANPYGPTFSAGGSSSGSAVGVAAGLTVASVGTETSGSLIAPAAFNGVVAVKPTHGLVPAAGIVPLVASQDTAGTLGRCVADAAVLLAALAGPVPGLDPRALPVDALAGVRVGVLAEDVRTQRSPVEDTADNPELLERIDEGLRAAGADPVAVTLALADEVARFDRSFTRVVLGGLGAETIPYLRDEPGLPVRDLAGLHAFNLADPRARMPTGQLLVDLALLNRVGADHRQRALEHRGTATRILDATFDAHATDVLVSTANRHSSLYATAGFPAVCVPLGLRANGMPAGATFIGRHGADGALIAVAHAFEQATRLRRPPVLDPA